MGRAQTTLGKGRHACGGSLGSWGASRRKGGLQACSKPCCVTAGGTVLLGRN